MSTYVTTDARVECNGVNLSAWVSEVTIETSKEPVDDTNMGDTDRQRLVGLGDWKFTVKFAQDYVSGGPHSTLWTLYNAGTSFTMKVRPTSAAISTTNPEYSGTVRMFNYNPITGSIGTRNEFTAEFLAASALTVATS